MPAYETLQPPYSLAPGDSFLAWNAEQPAAGNGGASATERVALVTFQGDQPGFEVTGFFSGAPGAFEIDIQVADVDSDTQYQTVANGNITSVDAVNQTFHFDGAGIRAKFARALMRSRTNAVNCTLTLKR